MDVPVHANTGPGWTLRVPELVGRTLEVPEEHYRFGIGPLTLTVRAVIGAVQLTDGPWVYVRGEAHRWDGSTEERQVLLRLAALTGR